ncbi:hypothetical protein [Corticicoccus populi]|uniref:Uncharacterized protein n=1 Tax=Corticicoccus populi TaxID=1812821 RepID=A0ABW5WZF7_9STAP
MMWIVYIVLICTAAGVITDYLKRMNQKEKLRLKQLDKEIELEQLKQENYLLENEEMRITLNRIKEENKERSEEKYASKENKWLIEETKEREKQ